jgi:tetratricopeptide (TPR) repeat protein
MAALLVAAGAAVSAPDYAALEARVRNGQLALAESQLRAVVARGATDAAAHVLLGITRLRQGQPAEAAAVLQKGLTGAAPAARTLARDIAQRLESADALVQIARLDAQANDPKGATLSLVRALALAPSSEEVLHAYAQLMLGLRSYLKALQVLDPLTRMCPADAQYHYLLGVALLQAGDMPRAVEFLEKAERLEPDRTLTLVALAIALNEQKRYDAARPLAQRALEREPENIEALAVLAAALEGLGELAPAEQHIDRVIAAAPRHHTANLVKGLIQMKQARYAEARPALEKAVAANPTSKAAHYQLSLAYARLGEEALSQKHLELYRKAMRDIEERVLQIRREAGAAPPEGMGQ